MGTVTSYLKKGNYWILKKFEKCKLLTKTAGPSVAHGWHVHELKNQVLKIFGGTQKNWNFEFFGYFQLKNSNFEIFGGTQKNKWG